MGGVAAAAESAMGNIYVGVCVDTACSLGVCAERNAIFSMITNGENEIQRVMAVDCNGKAIPPCGACREFYDAVNAGVHMEILRLCWIMTVIRLQPSVN